jgi:hypothetical protein
VTTAQVDAAAPVLLPFPTPVPAQGGARAA